LRPGLGQRRSGRCPGLVWAQHCVTFALTRYAWPIAQNAALACGKSRPSLGPAPCPSAICYGPDGTFLAAALLQGSGPLAALPCGDAMQHSPVLRGPAARGLFGRHPPPSLGASLAARGLDGRKRPPGAPSRFCPPPPCAGGWAGRGPVSPADPGRGMPGVAVLETGLGVERPFDPAAWHCRSNDHAAPRRSGARPACGLCARGWGHPAAGAPLPTARPVRYSMSPPCSGAPLAWARGNPRQVRAATSEGASSGAGVLCGPRPVQANPAARRGGSPRGPTTVRPTCSHPVLPSGRLRILKRGRGPTGNGDGLPPTPSARLPTAAVCSGSP